MWDWLKGFFSMFSRPSRETDAAPEAAPAPSPTRSTQPAPAPQAPSQPGAGQAPSAPSTPQQAPSRQGVEALLVEVEKRDSSWFARISGEEFLVGADVRYGGGRRGLMLRAPASGFIKYYAGEWRDANGVWADMIAATAEVEGKGDLCTVNSYDTADFTFGLMQWAAHTPDDNFVLLLRKLLSLPNAPAYFPDLSCNAEGRIARRTEGGVEVLETASSTTALRRYLNPESSAVDEAEVIAAAKLMHWVRHDAVARNTLISFAIEHYRDLVKMVAAKVPLDGKTDVEVMCCADIRHQGRGTYAQMRAALQQARSVEALLEIGADRYPERIEGLRAQILTGLSERRFGLHRYNAAAGEMVRAEEGPPPGEFRWLEAHATRNNITRNDQWGVYKLSEAGAPTRDPAADAVTKAEALRRIALWLQPKQYTRYRRPEGGRTRCNIYAYDFVTLAGAYLPRVWWDGDALNELNASRAPTVIYRTNEKNVRELTANDLMRWFRAHSSRYGWREVGDVRTLQDHANAGGVAIIVARHRNEGSSGHITVVAPENSTDENGAAWNAKRDGGPFVPVQSQAGSTNFTFGVGNEWWKYDYMAEHGFWVHD